MNVNLILKGIVTVVIVTGFLYLYENFFGSKAENIADEAVVRAHLSDITKMIAIDQDQSGRYGTASEKLPFVGCELDGSYLAGDSVQTKIKQLSSKTEVVCISDGIGSEIKSWAIAAKVAPNKYWCVDESGNRKEMLKKIQIAFCE